MKRLLITTVTALSLLLMSSAIACADSKGYTVGHDEIGPHALSGYQGGATVEGACYSAIVLWMMDWDAANPQATKAPDWFVGKDVKQGCYDYIQEHS
jgi:hypothetical protein